MNEMILRVKKLDVRGAWLTPVIPTLKRAEEGFTWVAIFRGI